MTNSPAAIPDLQALADAGHQTCINSAVDYNTKTITISTTLPRLSTLPYLDATVSNSDGVIISTGTIANTDSFQGQSSFAGNLPLGLQLSDVSTYNISAGTLGACDPIGERFPLTKRVNAYLGVPLVITRGDSVVYATVTSDTEPQVSGNVSLANVAQSVGQFVTGPAAGDYFVVNSVDEATSLLDVDRQLTGYSGSLVKLMPRRTVVGYSGWSETGTRTTFDLDQDRPTGSSLSYPAGSYFSYGLYPFSHPYLTGNPTLTGRSVIVPEDAYGRSIEVGDLFTYTSQETLQPATGLVVFTSTTMDGPELYFWPAADIDIASPVGVYLANHYTLELYPDFNSTCLTTLTSNQTGIGSSTFRTPKVEALPVVGNGVDGVLQFNVGPLQLADGQHLTGSGLPSLNIRGAVYEDGTRIVDISGCTTQSTSAALVRDGVLVITNSNFLDAVTTIQVQATVCYGSATARTCHNIAATPVS